MIICLSHIAYNILSSSSIQEFAINTYPDAVRIKEQYNILNWPSKHALCRNPVSKYHDLYLIKVSPSVAIEFTNYQAPEQFNCKTIQNVSFSTSSISFTINSHNKSLDIPVLHFLGFDRHDDLFCRSDLLISKKLITISIVECTRSNKSYLDDIGYTCIAFISTNIEDDSQYLLALNCTDHTDIVNMSIGGQNLLIWMARLPGGAIIELIQLQSS